MSQPYRISKSKYLAGLQCHKLIWYWFHAKELIPQPDASTQAVFDQGNAIGELARKCYPNGIDLSQVMDIEEVIARTKEAVNERRQIFEAGFATANSFARADILNPVRDDEWDIIEVKSSTNAKLVHKHDLAHQRYTYERAGLKIHNCYVCVINANYTREGELDLDELFTLIDVTQGVEELLPAIEPNLERLQQVLAMPNEPYVRIGKHCNSPNHCPMHDICWNFLPTDSVFTLTHAGERAFKWLDDGIADLREIPLKAKLSRLQTIQLNALRTEEIYVDKAAIAEFLKKIRYPLSFLDFETVAPAIPPYSGVHPYQNTPFQFSLHRLESPDSELLQYSFLADGTADPRPELLEKLQLWLGTKGSVLAYNAGFEIGVLDAATVQFSKFRPWFEQVRYRFVDLLSPFRSFHYYHPAQRGSASIKSVLPAMTGRKYSDLDIGDGQLASTEFIRTHFYPVSEQEKQVVRERLLAYCGLDTEAMVLLLRELEQLTK